MTSDSQKVAAEQMHIFVDGNLVMAHRLIYAVYPRRPGLQAAEFSRVGAGTAVCVSARAAADQADHGISAKRTDIRIFVGPIDSI